MACATSPADCWSRRVSCRSASRRSRRNNATWSTASPAAKARANAIESRIRRRLSGMRRVPVGQHVADAADGVEERSRPTAVELTPHAGDQHVYRVADRIEVVIPHVGQDLGAAQHPARVSEQVLDQGVLAGAQLDRCPAPTYLPGGYLELEIGEAEGCTERTGGPARERAETGQQLLHVERLGQVVVGAGVEARHPIVERVPGGEHDDRGAATAGAGSAAHREA